MGLGFRVWVQGFRFRVLGLGFEWGLGFRAKQDFGLRASGDIGYTSTLTRFRARGDVVGVYSSFHT